MVTNEELIAALRDAHAEFRRLHESFAVGEKRPHINMAAIRAIDDILARADEPQSEPPTPDAGEPEVWVVLDENGHSIYCASYPSQCHEHINDAIIEHDMPGAGKWCVRRMVPFEPQAVPELAGDGFYWMAELFATAGDSLGKSLGYHTGLMPFTTLDPYQAKRYATKDQAQTVVDSLSSAVGIWKAVEHGFHTVPTPDAEPVAWMTHSDYPGFFAQRDIADENISTDNLIPLYATPQPAAVPDGWVPVPIEPTAEMIKKFREAYSGCLPRDISDKKTRLIIAYTAMLRAAPEPPKEGE